MLHLLGAMQVEGILKPDVLLKRYQPVASVLSHLCDEPVVACVTLRSISSFRI